MVYEPTLTPQSDMAPVPRVEFIFTSVAPGASRATVYRLSNGQADQVRGSIDVYAEGGFSGIDTEPPFNEQIGYRAELFAPSGASLGFTDTAYVTVAFFGTVMHVPGDPDRAALLLPIDDTVSEIVRPFEGELVRPLGRSRPVYIGRGRSGISQVNLHGVTMTEEAAAAVDAVFGGYGDEQLPVVCFRSSLRLRLPQPFFAVVMEPKQRPLNARAGGTRIRWELVADEAEAPFPGLTLALYTYEDVESNFGTYADIEGYYLTYRDAESDFAATTVPPAVAQGIVETPPGSGYFATGDLVETSPGSGYFIPRGVPALVTPEGYFEIPA